MEEGAPVEALRLGLLDGEGWRCCRVRVPSAEIAWITAILEAYDNEFLVRTEGRGSGWLRIWYPVTSQPTLGKVLCEMKTLFPTDVGEYFEGMAGLDDVYPDEAT